MSQKLLFPWKSQFS